MENIGPILARGGYCPALALAAGDPLKLNGSFPNIGAAGVGLTLMVWGPAVASDLLEVDAVWVGWLEDGSHQRHNATVHRQGDVFIAQFPDAPIPQGVPLDTVMKAPRAEWRAATAALAQAQMSVGVSGRVVAAGDVEVHVGLVPQQNPDGHHNWTSRLQVRPQSRRPLRWAGADTDALLAMMQPRTLFATVALPSPGDVGALMAEWHDHIAGLAEGSWDLLRWLPGGGCRAGRLTPKAIPRWKRWAALVSGLEGGGGFSASRATGPWPEDGDPVFTTDGFACTRRSGATMAAPCSLALWVDLSTRPPELADTAEAVLVSLVDRAMAGGGLQAAVGRWRDRPHGQYETVYERACGVSGARSGTRWLRAVTPQVWLGPDLWAKVAGPIRAAEAVAVGDGVRLTLQEGATLDDLEAELAAILPGT